MYAILAGLLMATGSADAGATLGLPSRPPDASGGQEIARQVRGLPLHEREERILAEIRRGNIPDSLRHLVRITVVLGGTTLNYDVTPDYLAVGSDEDGFLVPLTPRTAQAIADLLDCSLPTPRMVDEIFRNASVRLEPHPIAPGPEMTTVPVFFEHNRIVRRQRKDGSQGKLVAGHKKDVVITNQVFRTPGKVAIYGWHRLDGTPIQPLYTGHVASWVDYSHGIRLVRRRMTVNGDATTIDRVLADPTLAPLLSREGVMLQTRYESDGSSIAPASAVLASPPGEITEVLHLEPGVRIAINRPSATRSLPILLIFYALPNGNTIEQTIGRKVQPGDDWHFDIQHIGAQIRFLREAISDRTLVVAYLENDLRSWPAWRKANGDDGIPAILDAVRHRFAGQRTRLVLNGHSGGGSLVFGFLNRVKAIPDEIERIAFLDSNYAYETERHADKLAAWLKSSSQHALCVIAYNDAVALLDGKTFVSASGGTWGRSQLMRRDLQRFFEFKTVREGDLECARALSGRVAFLLRENPEKAILHTVQVERNGFIQSILSGTAREGVGYQYLGERAYTRYLREDSGEVRNVKAQTR